MHVHIATVGTSTAPVLKVINAISGIDKLYLLHTDGSLNCAEEIRVLCKDMIDEIHLIKVPISDFMMIVNAIYGIHREEYQKGVDFSINITGGTNLMTAAACYSSYYIRAKMYYSNKVEGSVKEQVIEVEAPKAIDVSNYNELTRKILRYILSEVDQGNRVSNVNIADHFSASRQIVSYHIKLLTADGLITQEDYTANGKKNGRMKNIRLTPNGTMIALHIDQ